MRGSDAKGQLRTFLRSSIEEGGVRRPATAAVIDSVARSGGFSAPRRPLSARELLALVLLLAAITAFYGLTMRPGDPWTDDFSEYVQEAKNISEGAPYGKVEYVYHQDMWTPGPAAYPPVLPLLLAPVYREFGLDLHPMKLMLLGFFVAALVMIYMTFRNELGPLGALGMVGIIGFNPFFWDFKDWVASDIPFLFLCYLALYLTEVVVSREVSGKRFIAYAILTGLIVGAACETRVVGIAMIPAVVAWGLIRYGKVLKSTAVMAIVCTTLELIDAAKLHTFQATFLALQQGRGSSFVGTVLSFARYYIGSTDRLWSNGHSGAWRMAFFALTVILMLVGMAVRHWRNLRVHDVFVLFYVPMLINAQQARYLIPIIPLYLFYVISGVQWVTRQTPRRYGLAMAGGLAAVVALIYIADYRTIDLHHLPFGTASPEAQQLFAYIEGHAAPSDVVEFFAPRTLSLYTRRKSSVFPHIPPPTPADMQAYFCRTGITYVVTSPWFRDQELLDFIAANRGAWSEPFANGRFDVYRLPEEGPGSACRTLTTEAR